VLSSLSSKALVFLCSLFVMFFSTVRAEKPIAIGSRLEPFVDDALIDSMHGAVELKLHSPVPREVAMTFDESWEGGSSGYSTVIKDDDIYRMYYRGDRYEMDDPPLRSAHAEVVCYAESPDGIRWTKPHLDTFQWPDAEHNNIIWTGAPAGHNFTPFKDNNPNCPPEQLYKAVGGTIYTDGLWTFQSADGKHWKPLSSKPVVTEGWFDSQNVAFWDAQKQRYAMYFRVFSEGKKNGIRLVAMCHSKDFETWSEPVVVEYPGSPPQEMYTNQIIPYYRAPHIYLGFPTRYLEKPQSKHIKKLPPLELRDKLQEVDPRSATALSDALFMSSRDGISFKRWDESFLRPGPQDENRWIYGDNFQGYGLYDTLSPVSEPEISMLFNEGSWRDGKLLFRRYTIRLDGFVSVNAKYSGGSVTTKPLTFEGAELVVNYATSAAGSVKVEVLNEDGTSVPGFTLDDAEELMGDTTSQVVTWYGDKALKSLAGKPIRLRFHLKDADLYSFQFINGSQSH
jgi:hypothetical protein